VETAFFLSLGRGCGGLGFGFHGGGAVTYTRFCGRGGSKIFGGAVYPRLMLVSSAAFESLLTRCSAV